MKAYVKYSLVPHTFTYIVCIYSCTSVHYPDKHMGTYGVIDTELTESKYAWNLRNVIITKYKI